MATITAKKSSSHHSPAGMEGRPAELIEEVINFNYTVGLPITLAQIGVTEDIPAKSRRFRICPDYVHNEPFEVTAKNL